MNRFDEYKIESRNGKWVVLGHKGDVKGTHPTKSEAQAQVAAIHASMKESIPPRKQWNPVVLSGVRRVKAGEDADAVALDIANRVPGFKHSQLGAYVAAYGSGKKKVTEGFFSAAEPDISDRDNKEKAVQDLLGNDNVDVKKVPDDELTSLLQGLGSITVESIDSQVRDIISVMREQKASRADVLEALQVHIGFNLREAKEVLQEHLREAEDSKEVKYGVYRKGGSIGTNNGKPVKVCDTAEEAKEHAKQLRKQLSPGEKSYYKLGYVVKPVKESSTSPGDLDTSALSPRQQAYMMDAAKLANKGLSVDEIQDELGYGIVDEAVLRDTFEESSSRRRAALKEATDISHYMKHARDLLQGVSEVAGLDPEMAALCFAIWNLKLDRTEEDPTAELVDMWSKGEGAISLKNGRRPGPKEAEALPALIQGMNDIIADREENLNRG